MDISLQTIDGIPVLFAGHNHAHTTTVEVFVKAGSVYETKETNGIAHFLEHMFFTGGKKYKTPQAVAEAVDSFGGTFNAFTGEEYVGYYITCAPMYLAKAIDILADMLVHATFSEHEIEEERNVVLQELYMGQDDLSRIVNRNRIKRYYGNNSYGRPTIGTEKNIKEKFSRDMLMDYKKSLYTKDNLVICITGRVLDKDHIQQEIAQAFHHLPSKKTKEKPPFPFHIPKTHEHRDDKKTKTMHVVMGAQGHSMHDEKRFNARVLSIILGGYRTSRLFQEIRERQGLAYYISAYHFENDTTGTFKIKAGLKKDHRKQGLQSIYGALEEICAGGITQEERDRAISYLKGVTEMGLETSSQMATFLGPQVLFTGTYLTPEQILKKYEDVTLDELHQTAKNLLPEHLYTYWIE